MKLPKFLNYNKIAKTEYTESMLPHNRREVFFDILKLNWKSFLLYGLIMLLCSLPLMITEIFKWIISNEILKAMATAQGEELTALAYERAGMLNMFVLIEAICILLIFIYLAGFITVIRQYAWEECVFFSSDFAKGLKANLAQMLPLGVLFSVSYAFGFITYNLAQLESDVMRSLLMMLPFDAFLLFVVPITAYGICSIPIYQNGFGKVIFSSLRLYFVSPFKTLLALICCLCPFAPLLIPNFTCMVICGALIAMLLPWIILAFTLFSYNQFDKFINAEQFPELVGRGVFQISENEPEENEN